MEEKKQSRPNYFSAGAFPLKLSMADCRTTITDHRDCIFIEEPIEGLYGGFVRN